jgi:hypothetical protein
VSGISYVDLVASAVFLCIADIIPCVAVCGAHISQTVGVKCASTLHPNGANGFAL